jgi:hypothetical protein
MSGNCELGRGLLRREKNATEGGAGRFEKPAPDARAAPPEAHESLIGRKTVEEVPLTGLSLKNAAPNSPPNSRPLQGVTTRGRTIANPLFSRIPKVGLEPTRPCGQRILSAAEVYSRAPIASRFFAVPRHCRGLLMGAVSGLLSLFCRLRNT